ncbi:hypothetical protein [Sulfitobacter sp. R18_1]|uniref:hypothetical protein n=1 Tax=Sulfitobacter sp. R18_1 TaxID=2821104 RepID=UPI001ADCC345|nr:hypothetical protein [Sulfitobacter sp. R18_1]MBO9431600.1 hypothetical protein [Sulfitobacter sp. R18_1]
MPEKHTLEVTTKRGNVDAMRLLMDQFKPLAVQEATDQAEAAFRSAEQAAISADQASSVVPSLKEDIQSIAERSSPRTALVDPKAVVAKPVTTNKWNPEVSDVVNGGDSAPSIGTTTANQLHRLRGNTTGVLSAQNSSSLWSFWASRKSPMLEPSTEYTISCHGAPLGAYFYTNGYLQFFNADGSLHSYITSGFTVSPAGYPREITFTTPAAPVSIAPNMRNVTDFSASIPVTEEHVDIVSSAVMINEGDTALPFAPYSDGTFSPSSSIFEAISDEEMTFAMQGDYTYFKTGYQQSAGSTLLSRVKYGYGADPDRIGTSNGTIDTQGHRIVDEEIPRLGLIAAFNQSEDVILHGTDEGAPSKVNSMYIGGSGHSTIGYMLTMAGHGKTEADVGSLWSDGVDNHVLVRVKSSSEVLFIRMYTGSDDKWTISTAAPASLTLTHVSGATNTADFAATDSVQSQGGCPVVRNYTSQATVDGVAVADDGEKSATAVSLSEYYEVINAAKQLDYLIANVGATPVDYLDTSIDTQFSMYNEHTFFAAGGMAGRSAMGVKNAFRRGLNVDYTGFFQRQRLTLTGDYVAGAGTETATVHLYVPDMASTVAGYDFQSMADITDNTTEVRIPRMSCADPNDPASHFCMVGKDAGGNVVANMLIGYDRTYGLGVPATRAASVNDVMFFSSAEKLYPIAIDEAAGDAAAGDLLEAGWFVVPFAPDPTGDLTIPGIIVEIGNRTFCYITAHQTLANKSVSITGYNGRAVSIIKDHANVTIHDDYVSAGAVEISVASGYGDVVLELI